MRVHRRPFGAALIVAVACTTSIFGACSSGGTGGGSSTGNDGGLPKEAGASLAPCPRFAWVSRIGGGGADAPRGLAELDDGTIALGGSVNRGAILGVGQANQVRAEYPASEATDAGVDAAQDADAATDAGATAPGWSPYLGFVATYDSAGAFAGALTVSTLAAARPDVVAVAARPGARTVALLAVARETQESPATTTVAFAHEGTIERVTAPTDSVLLVETDAHGAYLSSRVLATGARDGKIIALENGGFAVAVGPASSLDPDTPLAITEDRAVIIARYDAAGTRSAAHVLRPLASGGFYRLALAPGQGGKLLFAGSCIDDYLVDAKGAAPVAVKCGNAGIVASFAADDALNFASPIAVSDTNPSVAGVFDERGTTWVHVVRGTGVMEGLLGYDAKGAPKLHIFDRDANFRASVSLALGPDDIVRFGAVSDDKSRVAGSIFGVAEPAVVMARGRDTDGDWARLLGPSPGAAHVALASGNDVLLAGTFSGIATFGVDSKARTLPASGGDDIFVARVILDGDECLGRANDAGFPTNPEPLVCSDGVDDFQSSAKPGGTSFDWNCNGVEESELQGLSYGCSWVGGRCPAPGWVMQAVPRCGESGLYSDCKSSGAYTCASNWTTRTQRCK